MNISIVKNTCKEVFKQPVSIVISVLFISLIFLLLFFTEFSFNENSIIRITILSFEINEVSFFLNVFLPDLLNIFLSGLFFLLLLLIVSIAIDFLADPITSILVIKIFSRVKLLLSKIAGVLLAISVQMIILSLLIMLICFIKTGENLSSFLFWGTISFLSEIFICISLAFMLSMMSKNYSVIFLVCLSYYFLSSFIWVKFADSELFISFILKYIFFPLGLIIRNTRSLFLNDGNPIFILLSLTPLIIFIFLGTIIFNKKDL